MIILFIIRCPGGLQQSNKESFIMQTSRWLSVLNVPSVKRIFSRNKAVSLAVNVDKNVPLKPFKEVPGPPSLPFIGQILNFMPWNELSDVNKLQENLYRRYGSIVRLDASLGKPAFCFLFDPEATAFVLRHENVMPLRPGFESLEYYRKFHNKPKGHDKKPTGLITDQGQNWRHFRTTVNQVLLQIKTIRLYTPLVDEVAQDMIKRMKTTRDEKNMLKGEFNTEMNLWALESIGVIGLGGRLNCFDPNLPENGEVRRLIKCVHDIFKVSNDLDFKPNLWRYYPTKAFKRAMKLYDEQEYLAGYFVGNARKKLLTSKTTNGEKGILEKLLEIDERTAVIMASDMLFAGVDTAAITMTAVLYHLGTHIDKQDKLRQELSSDFESTKYLRACIKESMRLMPVVPGNLRMITKDYNIFGYRIPKGTFVVFNHQFMSKMESQFPKPNEYIPERWFETGPLSYKNAHPFAFNVFGFGVRMCIGRRIAEMEIETFLKRVILNFKVEWFGPPPEIQSQSLNYIKGPYNFIFKDV
uniref:Cytochrome P450 n=1 Tax=Pectinophora gossypiella TaxID=13191 RepID=A0A1E1W6Z4_PECGO